MARKGPRPGRAAPKASISLMLPVDLLEQINNQANSLGISRAKWFELVASDALEPVERVEREPMPVVAGAVSSSGRKMIWGAELAS